MNRIKQFMPFLVASLIILASGPLPTSALTPTREQVKESWERRFQDLDKNRDGKVSLEEYFAFFGAEHPQRRQFLVYEFRKYDRNGDGFITHEEHLAPVSLEDEFRAQDLNQDGRLSQDEFLHGKKVFPGLDRNHDGFIDLKEYLEGYRRRSTGK
jgi:Ca2+-binding EF-hand superfamily protein